MLIHGAGQDDVEYIHSSRLKDGTLFNVPGLCESKSGIHIVLNLQDEMSWELFEACIGSTHDDGIIIAKAATVMCGRMFSNECSFNEDLSRSKQIESVTNQLLQMMTLIVGGVNVEDSNLQLLTHVPTN